MGTSHVENKEPKRRETSISELLIFEFIAIRSLQYVYNLKVNRSRNVRNCGWEKDSVKSLVSLWSRKNKNKVLNTMLEIRQGHELDRRQWKVTKHLVHDMFDSENIGRWYGNNRVSKLGYDAENFEK